MARRGPTIASTALDEIHRRGPLALDDIVKVIVDAGLSRAKNPSAIVASAIYRSEFIRDWEGRYCSLADQLEGAIFSHPTTVLERRNEVVLLSDDLGLIERLAIRRRPNEAGGEIHLDYVGEFFELPWPDIDRLGHLEDQTVAPDTAEELVGFLREIGLPYTVDDEQALAEFLEESRFMRLLHGPPGWLPILALDDLLGIRVEAGEIRTLRLRPRDVRAPHVGGVAAEVAKLARRLIGPDASWFGPPAVALEDLLRIVVTEAPHLLRRPLPPFSEVVQLGGLEVIDGLVGHRGTDWAAVEAYVPTPDQEAWGFVPAGKVQ